MYKPTLKLQRWHRLDDMSALGSSFFSSSPYYRLSCSSVFQPLMSAQTGFSIGARQSSVLDYWSLIQLRTQVKWRKDRLGTWQLKIIIFYSSWIERGLSKSIRGMVGLEQKCYLCIVMDKQNGKETKENWFWFGHFHNLSFYHFHADFFSLHQIQLRTFSIFLAGFVATIGKNVRLPSLGWVVSPVYFYQGSGFKVRLLWQIGAYFSLATV